jgi:hypothetical protein
MIKATDLRVGNLVNFYENISLVTPEIIFAISELEKEGKKAISIEPIPIAEELLIKAGAIKIGENSYNLNGMQINLTNGKWIEYVHQIELEGIHHLQNVFYFIMGKELIFEGLN